MMAHAGATLKARGTMPLVRPRTPSSRSTALRISSIVIGTSPALGTRYICLRVLRTSMGLVSTAAMVPAAAPAIKCANSCGLPSASSEQSRQSWFGAWLGRESAGRRRRTWRIERHAMLDEFIARPIERREGNITPERGHQPSPETSPTASFNDATANVEQLCGVIMVGAAVSMAGHWERARQCIAYSQTRCPRDWLEGLCGRARADS